MDGRLLASLRLDDLPGFPRPITADMWYMTDDDVLRSLVILQPELVAR